MQSHNQPPPHPQQPNPSTPRRRRGRTVDEDAAEALAELPPEQRGVVAAGFRGFADAIRRGGGQDGASLAVADPGCRLPGRCGGSARPGAADPPRPDLTPWSAPSPPPPAPRPCPLAPLLPPGSAELAKLTQQHGAGYVVTEADVRAATAAAMQAAMRGLS